MQPSTGPLHPASRPFQTQLEASAGQRERPAGCAGGAVQLTEGLAVFHEHRAVRERQGLVETEDRVIAERPQREPARRAEKRQRAVLHQNEAALATEARDLADRLRPSEVMDRENRAGPGAAQAGQRIEIRPEVTEDRVEHDARAGRTDRPHLVAVMKVGDEHRVDAALTQGAEEPVDQPARDVRVMQPRSGEREARGSRASPAEKVERVQPRP